MGACGFEEKRRGDGTTFPKVGQTVTIHYEGRLENGDLFDSSLNRNMPFKFVVGSHHVLKGWDESIKKMSIGSVAEITCPPEYAYGKLGYPGVIPKNATLYFRIELLGID